MPSKRKALVILEKDKLRGEVPSREVGIRDKVYGAYLDNLNPRENEDVQTALAAHPNPRFKEFLDRINTPRYHRVSLQTIAKACEISLMEFQEWWNKASTQVAIAKAQMGSIKITDDMVQDAQSKDVACSRCDDLGFVAAGPNLPATVPGYRRIDDGTGDPKFIRTCPDCQGRGRSRKPGDQHARDTIMKMSGIIQPAKGISITQNFGGASHASAVDSLNEMMTFDVTPADD